METYLLFGLTGEKLSNRRIAVGFRLWIRCQRLWHRDFARADRSLSHSILRGRLGSGIDDMEGGRYRWGEQRKKE